MISEISNNATMFISYHSKKYILPEMMIYLVNSIHIANNRYISFINDSSIVYKFIISMSLVATLTNKENLVE